MTSSNTLFIERAANGWMIHGELSDQARRGVRPHGDVWRAGLDAGGAAVAETAQSLAHLVLDWALAQEREAAKQKDQKDQKDPLTFSYQQGTVGPTIGAGPIIGAICATTPIEEITKGAAGVKS